MISMRSGTATQKPIGRGVTPRRRFKTPKLPIAKANKRSQKEVIGKWLSYVNDQAAVEVENETVVFFAKSEEAAGFRVKFKLHGRVRRVFLAPAQEVARIASIARERFRTLAVGIELNADLLRNRRKGDVGVDVVSFTARIDRET